MRLACVASVSVVQYRKSELESKIPNPGNFCLWNPECGKILLMESGIQLEILLTFGIQHPSSTDKDWKPAPVILNPQPEIQNLSLS